MREISDPGFPERPEQLGPQPPQSEIRSRRPKGLKLPPSGPEPSPLYPIKTLWLPGPQHLVKIIGALTNVTAV
jgi:hypothetical protein